MATMITLQTLRTIKNALPGIEGDLAEQAILKTVFDVFANKRDWKAPIDHTIFIDFCEWDADVIKRAIAHFTATDATVVVEFGSYHVTAKGYRNGPAGG